MKLKKLGNGEFKDLTAVKELDLAKYMQRIGYQVFNTIQHGHGSVKTLSALQYENNMVLNELISRAKGRIND